MPVHVTTSSVAQLCRLSAQVGSLYNFGIPVNLFHNTSVNIFGPKEFSNEVVVNDLTVPTTPWNPKP